MNSTSNPKARPSEPVAPAWHTIVMIVLIMGPFIQAHLVEAKRSGETIQTPPALQIYLIGAVVQCIFFLWAWWGLRLRRYSVRELVSHRWTSWKEFSWDIALAFLFWGGWYIVLTVVKIGLAATTITSARASGMIYPNSGLEVALWIPNAVLAGIVEEFVFRGYLLRQFTAWTRSAAVGLLLQAILFGVAHAYLLGLLQVIVIATSGMLIGAFVIWRRNLRSAMIFHAWADIFGALIVRGLPFQ